MDQTKVAATSGGCGDIIYSIPVLRELGVRDVYIKLSYYLYGSLYSTLRRLMISEGFNPLPTSGEYDLMNYDPKIKFDYDIDRFREMNKRGVVHIQQNMRLRFGLKEKPYEKWLSLPTQEGDYSVIHLTNRWRKGSQVDWKKVLESIEGKVYFTGFQTEYLDFLQNGDIQWWPTEDLLEMAGVIAGAKAVYCNQSVALTIAQGLGKNYYVEVKPGKSNTLFRSPNEHIL